MMSHCRCKTDCGPATDQGSGANIAGNPRGCSLPTTLACAGSDAEPKTHAVESTVRRFRRILGDMGVVAQSRRVSALSVKRQPADRTVRAVESELRRRRPFRRHL